MTKRRAVHDLPSHLDTVGQNRQHQLFEIETGSFRGHGHQTVVGHARHSVDFQQPELAIGILHHVRARPTGNTDRFAAAAVVKPVINWTSFVLYSDLPQYFYRYWFATAPWEDPQEYWRRSPLSLVGNVQTPTLMMVGGADLRTPRAETEQYYSALQLRGVPTRLVIIPDAFHGIANSRPSRLLSKVAEILRWFETYDPANADTGGDGSQAAD